jgi:sugar-specific transcriptional regulator TrmB
MDVENKLARIGITGNLFRVYSAAIELGDVPVSEVAARAGLARTTAYDAVARLLEMGMVEVVHRAGKRHVIAHDPSVLLEQAEARRQMLTEMMPQLRSMYNRAKGKPHIRFHEGEEALSTVLWDSISTDSKLLRAIFSMNELKRRQGLTAIDAYKAERVARGIRMRVIRSAGRDTDDIWPGSEAELRDLRFAPDTMDLGMTILIYGSRVAMLSSTREDYGLIIESEEFATLQRTLFDAIWEVSRPPAATTEPSA